MKFFLYSILLNIFIRSEARVIFHSGPCCGITSPIKVKKILSNSKMGIKVGPCTMLDFVSNGLVCDHSLAESRKIFIIPHTVRPKFHPIALAYSCPSLEYCIGYLGGDFTILNGIGDYESCRALCQKHRDCKIHTWDSNSLRCHLKNETGLLRVEKSNFFSGGHVCNPACVHLGENIL